MGGVRREGGRGGGEKERERALGHLLGDEERYCVITHNVFITRLVLFQTSISLLTHISLSKLYCHQIHIHITSMAHVHHSHLRFKRKKSNKNL